MRLGVALSVISLIGAAVVGADVQPSECVGSHVVTGCDVTNTGTEIDIGATVREEGAGGGSGGGGSGGDGEVDEAGTGSATQCVVTATDLCRGNYETAGLPDVSMDDLASFRPAAPTASSEPAGIGIAGMPTNLVVAASTHTVTGDLFGYAVTVRFTPTAYVISHGDGTSARTTTPGASWASLGQAQFTPTATSHTYAARGDFTVTATTEYVAQVDFGGGWRAVPGTLTLTSGGYALRIVEARTALVDRTCLEAPAAPGC
jgi:hypothetical protein